jgi:uncharacterized membrane protein
MTGRHHARLVAASMLLGMGMGGFADGIVFHQILQTHSMLSARIQRDTVVGLEANMFWDGIFHAATWCITAFGLALLWRLQRQSEGSLSTRMFVGGLLLGWGVFNVVEGTVNHHILHLHHVIETPNHLAYDVMFLAFGALLTGIGWGLVAAPAKT